MRWILPLAVLSLGWHSVQAADAKPELKIGMVSGMFRDVEPSMVQALAKPFRDLMSKQTGFSGDVEIVDDPMTLTEKLKDKKLQLGVFHGFEFAWAKQKCDDLVPLVITMPPGGKVQGVVVVHRDSKYKTLADLKGDSIVIPRGAKAHTLAFIEKARTGFADDVATPKFQVKLTPEDVLNNVSSGDDKAALMDIGAMEGYRSLQPGAFKTLRVLEASEEFPPAVVAYRKGTLTDAEVEQIRKGLSGAAKTPSGKMLMTLWNLKGFTVADEAYTKSTDDILKAYPVPAVTVTKKPGSGGTLTGSPKK
jgi:ABC-type phosphate/phosphonate transport system substrate-binding protein